MNLQCLGALPASARDGMLLMYSMKHGLVRGIKVTCLANKRKLEATKPLATCPVCLKIF